MNDISSELIGVANHHTDCHCNSLCANINGAWSEASARHVGYFNSEMSYDVRQILEDIQFIQSASMNGIHSVSGLWSTSSHVHEGEEIKQLHGNEQTGLNTDIQIFLNKYSSSANNHSIAKVAEFITHTISSTACSFHLTNYQFTLTLSAPYMDDFKGPGQPHIDADEDPLSLDKSPTLLFTLVGPSTIYHSLTSDDHAKYLNNYCLGHGMEISNYCGQRQGKAYSFTGDKLLVDANITSAPAYYGSVHDISSAIHQAPPVGHKGRLVLQLEDCRPLSCFTF